jgi:hypothetical protein
MKRIYKWDSYKGRKYKNCPYNFNFVKGCKSGLVVWWSETLFCLDLNKLPKGADLQDSLHKEKIK